MKKNGLKNSLLFEPHYEKKAIKITPEFDSYSKYFGRHTIDLTDKILGYFHSIVTHKQTCGQDFSESKNLKRVLPK